MSLMPRFESLERPEYTREYPTIECGDVRHFEALSLAGYIVAKCLENDNGGYVFIAPEITVLANNQQVIICSPEDLTDVIFPGFSSRIEIIDENQERGNLIIQHVMPGGWVNSLN